MKNKLKQQHIYIINKNNNERDMTQNDMKTQIRITTHNEKTQHDNKNKNTNKQITKTMGTQGKLVKKTITLTNI